MPNSRHGLLALILVLYFVLGGLFAAYTPAWQAPDEPAHYNYVRALATSGEFPVLRAGDYPAAYLDEIKRLGFPPGMSIEPIRYEFHQPPLYYALAAPVFALFGGALLPLRLLSVLLGAGIVVAAYLAARRIYPTRPAVALAASAFVAFLPQHLATVSQVGNDVLAELLLSCVIVILVAWVMDEVAPGGQVTGSTKRGGFTGRMPVFQAPVPVPCSVAWRLALGLLLGLILITKTTAYFAVGLAGLVLLWTWRRAHAPLRRVAADLGWVAVPAAILAVPWWVRDCLVYGWPDFLGLGRHDAVVSGQLRTAEYLAQAGWSGYLDRLVSFTFKSFWGVFGWLGAFMDGRVYVALEVLTALVAAGAALRLLRPAGSPAPEPPAPDGSRAALTLLAVSAAFTLLVYAWYNLQFVQHQGRYLFTALVPAGLAFGLGWDEALRPPHSRWLAAGLAILAAGLAGWSLLSAQGLPKWPLAICLAAAAGLAVCSCLPARLQRLAFAVPFLALPLLALYALFGTIVPLLQGGL